MREHLASQFQIDAAPRLIDVSIVMPCLNEAVSLPACIANARDALAELAARFGLTGEIVIADNGSTDDSRVIASRLGARVVAVPVRGYGAALIGGGHAALGRYIIFGDADGSYDFREAVAMVEALVAGADLCMGSRFKGVIAPGAMPWKNRYIGNPVLTGILKLMYGVAVTDAHCGLRALTTETFHRLKLSGHGMEFASEMVIKAALQHCTIAEVPATLSPDLRGRAPHLRPWRDGWRHVRYLFMLSPTWLFAAPAVASAIAATLIFLGAILHALAPAFMPGTFGNYWLIAASALGLLSHQSMVFGLASHLHGLREGYRVAGPRTRRLAALLSLETMLAAGAALMAAGFAVLVLVALAWTARDFTPTYSVLPATGGTLLVMLGAQTMFGGFLLAIIGGNEARFLHRSPGAAVLPFPTRP